MNDWVATAHLAMAMTDEKTHRRREPIILMHFNLARHLRNIGLSLLTFLS